MRNKKRFVKSFLTKTMLWAAFATLNYNPAIAANEYTINNFNDLSSALNSGSFGDILNPSQLQTGDKVILGGSINTDSSIEVAVNNVTINGGGGSSYVYSATGNSIDGLITGVGTNIETNIENINMQGFNNAIVVNSGNTLNFSNSLLTGNNTGILNNGTTYISNASITDGITNNDTLNFSGNNNITDLNGKGAVSNSGDLILTNSKLQGSYTQTSGSLSVVGDTDFSDSNTNISGGGFAIGNTTGNTASATFNGTIEEGTQLTVNSGSTFTNTGNVTLNNNDTLNGSFKQSTGTLNLAGVKTNGKLNSTGGVVNVTGNQTLKDGDTIGSGANLTVGATLTNEGGTINLDNGDKIESAGSISQTSGVINADNFSTTESGGSLQASGGSLNISSGGLTLNNENDNIADGATVDMDGNLTIKNGSVTLNTGDNLGKGTISQSGGSLTISEISTGSATLNSASGKLTLDGATIEGNDTIAGTVNTTIGANGVTISSTSADGIILNNGDTINGTVDQQGGKLSLAGVTTNGKLNSTGGVVNVTGNQTLKDGDTIGSGANLTVGATLTNEGGTINLDNGDKIESAGSISQTLGTSGTINANDFATTADGGSLKVNGGSLIISSDGLTLNNADDNIADGATVNMNGNLTINNGSVTLGSSDKLNSGTMNLTTNGNLNLNNITTEKTNINATGGNLQLSGVTLDNQKDNIEFGSKVTFDGDVNITKGNVEIDSGDNLTLTTGTITLNQADDATATLGVDGLKTDAVNLDLKKGTLNIINNGLELNNTSDVIQKGIITNVDGNLTINEGKVLLNEDDSWKSGIVSVSSNGKLQFEKFEATSNSDTTLKMDGAGSVTELLSSTVTFGNAENISDGTIAIDYDSGILIQSGSYNLSDMKTSGSISTINGGYENHTANTMTILNNTTPSVISNNDIAGDGFAAFGVDLYARNANKLQNSDVFKGDDLTLSDTNGTGEVYIADYVLNGKLNRSDAPIDRYYNFKIFDYENIDPNITISATDKETFTPIGYYRLFSNGDGSYTLGLTRYNKQVFRTQATTLAQYNNQLAIDDMVTSHHTLFGERKLAHASYNRFASATPNLGPYQYSQQDGGLWFKSYADLERLSMTQDLNVHNTAYGAIIGADFPIVNLKGGWKFIPTPYIGYNGAHQSFNDVSAYQTGGQLGFMGTFMKNHFISSHTIYGGGYYNEMHVDNVLDNTGNWFWGTAHRFAYNWNIKNHFIVQPTAFISYNMFGEQNLHSDFGDMGMKSGMLNGINIAPGINFIYAERDWSAYIGVQYMYNINEQVSGRAGNVYLPNLAMRHGYIQYGIGGTKNINDDLAAYAQVMFRNAGRTGVAFQLGLQYYFDIHEIGSKIKNGYNITLNKIKNIKKEK